LVAAAVLIDYETLSLSDRRALGGLHDSKQMTREDRERLYPTVLRAATKVSVAVRCVRGIDGRGLHNTNLEALASSLERVACDGAACLVDGFPLPGCKVDHRPVVDGDATSAAIAAASVIAKVSRDRYMHRAAVRLPGLGISGERWLLDPRTPRCDRPERNLDPSPALVRIRRLQAAGTWTANYPRS